MTTETLTWLILLLPLAAATGITLLTRRDRELSAKLSIAAVVIGFVLSVLVFFIRRDAPAEFAVPWLSVGGLDIDLGLKLDPLSHLMLLVVTGVGGAIHIYSYGYMHEDRSFSRYFASLSLFTFSMLGIVLASNFVQMFIFWELVGVSSYLLIGFWHEKDTAADAAKKAFLTNRLGDFGFLLGIIVVWAIFGTVNFGELAAKIAAAPPEWTAWAALAGLLIFCGAMGKSAQFPLHVWLPDAMEGPTPVSALIHAATMVAAGVYMLCRVFFLFGAQTVWPHYLGWLEGWTALEIISWIGGITSFLAALMAVQQSDIKRILAYSTLSQLGYMVMAVGLSGPAAGMYHLTTHAFFKALLFLGAGSVIYACHHEQDIWKMGGLRGKLTTTWRTFAVGTLALCGVPPFSGFYSKDAVLATAAEHNPLLFALGIAVAVLTTFYMSRLVLVAFFGQPRSDEAGHAHESPPVMVWPLRALAGLSLFGGVIGIDAFIGRQFGEAAHHGSFLETVFAPFGHAPLASVLGLGSVIFGFSFAYALYAKAEHDPLPAKLGALARWMRDRFYFDELYERLIAATHEAVSRLADWADRWLVAGLGVRGVHGTTDLLGRALRLAQTGNLQTYAFLTVAGLAIVLILFLNR
jgi:NADH-quinone oxidoreductase subunit L